MSLQGVALEHYRDRERLVRGVDRVASQTWRRVDPGSIAASWRSLLPAVLAALVGAQRLAAGAAGGYVSAALVEQGLPTAAEGRVVVDALTGVASDGRDLASLLYRPVVTSLVAIQGGTSTTRALAGGEAALRMIVGTQVADAGRAADQVALTARPAVSGYRRMLVGRSCSRCVILAGRWYRYNRGFDRHPRCDCTHVPAREDTGQDVSTNPRKYFDSLSAAEQDRAFTAAGAEAIRLGADINQVVNARRGMSTAGPPGRRRLVAVDAFGQRVYVTSEGVTTRGVAGRRLGARETGTRAGGGRYRSARVPRLMPETILAVADDREDAVRLLRRHGYIT
ncbi:hypothetical protein ACFHW1_05000 [Micromonospora sp. LOL_014]|uniref:VG15 protein n=1 Tax=Micromonospora sp. LOL_014 TaxID=3345415 RepID=UPI003A890797